MLIPYEINNKLMLGLCLIKADRHQKKKLDDSESVIPYGMSLPCVVPTHRAINRSTSSSSRIQREFAMGFGIMGNFRQLEVPESVDNVVTSKIPLTVGSTGLGGKGQHEGDLPLRATSSWL
jgi:hypothetical protein